MPSPPTPLLAGEGKLIFSPLLWGEGLGVRAMRHRSSPVSTSFLTLALFISAPGPAGLQKGDEFTFTGSVTDHVERTTQRLHREYKLSLRFLVLERQENCAEAVLLTTLQRNEDVVGGFAKPVTGSAPDKNSPPSVRLDFVRIYSDGAVHNLIPVGSPLRLNADTPARALPPIPLSS